jgi:GDP-6-deoxy-D-talose 4-dehydrogenase
LAGESHLLITGVSGFTGAHLAARFQHDGWRVSGMGYGPPPADVESREIDLADRAGMAAWIAECRPTHVIHLAALSHVVGEPLPFYAVNVVGTETLLEAIGDAGIVPAKTIIASSANIYGNAGTDPISEDTSPRPVNHYAVSKAAMELVVGKWLDRMPINLVRPFNYTGPGQSEAFLFAKLAAAFGRREPVMTLGNLDVARDLSHVSYVVEAYARLLTGPVVGATLNICSGQCITLHEAIASLRDLTGHMPEIVSDPALCRPDDIMRLQGDPARLIAAVGAMDCPAPREIFRDMLAQSPPHH